MTATKESLAQLISCDIIVWEGVITRYGSVKSLIEEGDSVRLATVEEINNYKEKQNGN